MERIEIRGITGSDYDDLLREFPIISEYAEVVSEIDSPGEDQEIGSIHVILELVPSVLNVAAALLTFLAARYEFKKRDRD